MKRVLGKISRDLNMLYDYLINNGDIKRICLDDRSQNLPEDARSQEIAKMLASSYHDQKELQHNVPLPYSPGGAWKEDIKIRRTEYLEALNENNLFKLNILFHNFFRNSGVDGLWNIAYFDTIVKGSLFTKIKFARGILRNFLTWKDLVGSDIKDLSISSIGNPWGYLLDDTLISPNSFIHHYYANRMKHLLVDFQRPIICEIGGGYGGFAFYLYKTLDSCVYVNFDLPEILLICSYYLIRNFPEKKILLFDKSMFGKPLSNLEDYDIILMPNYMLPFLNDKSVDIVVNTHSLSEMDYHTVEEYIRQISRISRRYFFHINSDEEVSNFGDHKEVKSSAFPIDKSIWKNLYTILEPFSDSDRCKEYLYERYDRK